MWHRVTPSTQDCYLFKLWGVLTAEQISHPTGKDFDDIPVQFIIKNGYLMGKTIGCLNWFKSKTCKYGLTSTFDSTKAPVLPYSKNCYSTWWGRKAELYWCDQYYYILSENFPQPSSTKTSTSAHSLEAGTLDLLSLVPRVSLFPSSPVALVLWIQLIPPLPPWCIGFGMNSSWSGSQAPASTLMRTRCLWETSCIVFSPHLLQEHVHWHP